MEPSAALFPQFVETPSGRLFALLYQPRQRANNKVVVLIPPFAEEMNKSRRQLSLQARRFCQSGHAVLIFDFVGTGDSDQRFADASITLWKENIKAMLYWLREQGFDSWIPWGVRFGALLLDDAINSGILPSERALLWQPVLSGKLAIRQFLRLQAATNLMSADKGDSVAGLEEKLSGGQAVEVAGYGISPDLYTESMQLDLQQTRWPTGCAVDWFQVLTGTQSGVPVAASRVMTHWQAGGTTVIAHTVSGDNFWGAAELVVVPALVEQTAAVLAGRARVRAVAVPDEH